MRANRGMLARASIDLAVAPLLMALLCGCTVLMTEPASITAKQRKAGISYEEAQAHLLDARANMKAGLRTLDQLHDVTVGGVGIGAGGAAVATMAGVHPDVGKTFLTFGGVTYAITQTSRLDTQTAIYSSGLRRLQCIEQNGHQLYQDTDALRSALITQRIPFELARARLEADLKQARTQTMSSLLATVAVEGDKALAEAASVRQPLDRYIAATDVGFEMVSAVDAAVESLNAQIRANRADAAEAANAGKIASDFVAAHAAPAAAASVPTATGSTEAAAAAQKLKALGQGTHDQLADQIQTDIAELRAQTDVVRMLLPSGRIRGATVRSCLSEISALGSVVILPSPAITVHPGGDPFGVNAYVDDGQALAFFYSGVTPSSQQLSMSSQGGGRFSVSAPADARPEQYTIRFFRASDPKGLPLDPPLLVKVEPKPTEAKPGVKSLVARPPVVKPPPVANPPAIGTKPADKPAPTPPASTNDNKLPIPSPPPLSASAASQ